MRQDNPAAPAGREAGRGRAGRVLVTGATGTVGRALVEQLLTAGQQVRAGVRDPATRELPYGAEPVHLDFQQPATAAPALAGVDRLFLMRPPAISDVRRAFGPLVDAAAAAGVRRVVVLSVLGVNPAMPHWRLERMVHAAGLPMTALRPAYFAQNLITAFGQDIRDRSQLALAAGSGKVSFVDTRDVAAVAARLLTQQAQLPGPLTLTGPQALTFGQAADLLTAELGRPIRYLRQSLRAHRRDLQATGAPPPYVNVQTVIDVTTRLGLASRVTDDIPQLLARPATSLQQFVHDHRRAWTRDLI